MMTNTDQPALHQYQDHRITIFEDYQINAWEFSNNGPPLLMLHGEFDNMRSYDYLIPAVLDKFYVIVFDFLGWNQSSKPENYGYTGEDRLRELETVVNFFALKNITIIAHGISGRTAVSYAAKHSQRVGRVVLLDGPNILTGGHHPAEKSLLFFLYDLGSFSRFIANVCQPASRMIFFYCMRRYIRNLWKRKNLIPLLYKPFSDMRNLNAFLKYREDLYSSAVSQIYWRSLLFQISGKLTVFVCATEVNDAYSYNFKELKAADIVGISKTSGYIHVDQPGLIASYLKGRV